MIAILGLQGLHRFMYRDESGPPHCPGTCELAGLCRRSGVCRVCVMTSSL